MNSGREALQFHEIQLRFLGYGLVDVRGEEGVGFGDFGTDGALDGGFHLGFGAGGDAGGG